MCRFLAAPSPLFVLSPTPHASVARDGDQVIATSCEKKQASVTRDMAPDSADGCFKEFGSNKGAPWWKKSNTLRAQCFAFTFVLSWLVLTFFTALSVHGWGTELSLPVRHVIFLPSPFLFLHFLQTGVLRSCIALVFFLRCVAHLQSFINNIIISLHFLVVHIVSSDESISACDFLRRRQNLHVSTLACSLSVQC